MSSFCLSKHLILVPILVMMAQLLLIRNVLSLNMNNPYLYHKCSANQGEYKLGSLYKKSLDSGIQQLSKDNEVFRGGFVYMDHTDPNGTLRVYITFQCRGDIYGSHCRSCFATARAELFKRCPRDKAAIIWYDQCFLEFSSISTGGKINYDDNICIDTARARPNAKTHTGDDSVLEFLRLFENLTNIAVTKRNNFVKDVEKPALYAAGEKRFGNKKIYVMVQCTHDLTPRACVECVNHNVRQFQDCYEDKPVGLKKGARVLGRSCNFRFERYPFVNAKTSPNYLKF
ncbi:receptor-like protein kinase-like protein [Arabidopsis thaliana]|uniref:Putative cysteine-rich repeat secretory protein 14 n=1 Tax=Arabidopsis thaliana TaxID=3702 RepID=CRR14_ARATH|nr:receptor-like protein kinase-like protein [Arabidopsis thaliana]Q9LJW1.2 RecName: Full=Putative cysteine-rich repeat secretory protein 14; Flags: Precursor [Arabidopsis thaliana]ANM64980.1 receptor-like protein kinase-like protein [Arabidopsis thaliana]|eukprot:NP_001326980.1 receptor-like protein kinase-like protein [Arabidopsis thaliana]